MPVSLICCTEIIEEVKLQCSLIPVLPLFIVSSLFTCLSTSSSFSHHSRLSSEGFNFPPASKLHYNYTSYFIELDGDNSLYAYRDGPLIKTHPGNPIISSRPGDLPPTSVHLFICRFSSPSRPFSSCLLPFFCQRVSLSHSVLVILFIAVVYLHCAAAEGTKPVLKLSTQSLN